MDYAIAQITKVIFFIHDECSLLILSIQCNQSDVLVKNSFQFYGMTFTTYINPVCQITGSSIYVLCCRRLSKFSFENPLRGDKSFFINFLSYFNFKI